MRVRRRACRGARADCADHVIAQSLTTWCSHPWSRDWQAKAIAPLQRLAPLKLAAFLITLIILQFRLTSGRLYHIYCFTRLLTVDLQSQIIFFKAGVNEHYEAVYIYDATKEGKKKVIFCSLQKRIWFLLAPLKFSLKCVKCRRWLCGPWRNTQTFSLQELLMPNSYSQEQCLELIILDIIARHRNNTRRIW